MNFWEFALLGGVVYFAIVTLVRMMRRRRDVLINELSQEAEAEQRRLREEARMEKRRQLREKVQQEQLKSRRTA